MPRIKQLLLDIRPSPTPSFSNFVVGRNAEAVYSLHLALSAAPAIRFIYLWGDTGCGKSHLLAACQATNVNAICVDDVQTLDEAAQIALFDLYNQMRDGNADSSSGKPERMLIVAGNAAPTKMGLRDDIATRLAWGLSYQLQLLSDEEKALALMSHAYARGMHLPTEVINYCLRNMRRDLPTLIATINALDEWSLSTKKPVTVPMLKQLLQFPLGSS